MGSENSSHLGMLNSQFGFTLLSRDCLTEETVELNTILSETHVAVASIRTGFPSVDNSGGTGGLRMTGFTSESPNTRRHAMTTHESVALDPTTQSFLDAIAAQGGKPIYTLSYAEARQVLENLQSSLISACPAEVEDLDFPVGPSGSVSVRIYRPSDVRGMFPAVIYCHGGGWISGSKCTHDRLMRDLANRVHAAIFFVNYTPSPEAQFPVPLEEAYAVTEYVASHANTLGVDAHRLVIAGDSVGGNMAAAITLMAKERGGPNIGYQVLLYPVTDASLDTGTYATYANGPWLTRPAMEWFWDAYAPNKSDREAITASPLRATKEQLTGLPPALVVTDQHDVLRDEGEQYASNLADANVSVTAACMLSTIHDFLMLDGLADTPAAQCAMELVGERLVKYFQESQWLPANAWAS